MGKKMMILGLAALMLSIGSFVFAQTMVSLDQAISHGVNETETRLAQGSKVAVLNFRSSSQSLSNYVLDEMTAGLERSGKLRVADKADIEFILRELNHQRSGNISDESAQSIGRILGAQYVISGSIEESGSNYVVQFRTMTVEPGALQTITRVSVMRDAQIVNLMGAGTPNTARTRADSSGSEAQTSGVTRPRADASGLTGDDASDAEDDTSNLDKTIILSAGTGGYFGAQFLHGKAYTGGFNLNDLQSDHYFTYGAPIFVNVDLFRYVSLNLAGYYIIATDSDDTSQNVAAYFSLFGQYPKQITDRLTVTPLLGIGYQMLFYNKQKGSNAVTRKDLSNDQDTLYLRPGVGLNFNLVGNFRLNARLIWDFMLYNEPIAEMKKYVKASGGKVFYLQHVPSLFIGVDYVFLKID